MYNYSAARGDVQMDLKKEDWFTLVEDNAAKSVAVDAGQVGGAQFTIEAQRIGKFKLTLAARMSGGNNPADIVVREIEVVPNGREQNVVFNGRLETSAEHEVNFPPAAIADASKLFVRLYPGPLSQVVEGMDAILRMPFGCFEQTSSATYPNVLALDYMKRTKKLTPEVHAKAEGFIANGYQRLLTFEVPGGGFSWFGNAPANKILTAYGLMEFSDMARVHDVDARLIERTQQWMAGQQQADGSWKPDANFINEGATNRYNSDVLRITAYLGWSLENTGFKGSGGGEGERVRGRAPEWQGGCVHTGGRGQLRGRIREGPRVHAPGDRDAARCAHGKRRAGLVDGGGDRRFRQGRERRRGDYGAGRAGAAEGGRGFEYGEQGAALYRGEERRVGNLGQHASYHHGVARAAAVGQLAATLGARQWLAVHAGSLAGDLLFGLMVFFAICGLRRLVRKDIPAAILAALLLMLSNGSTFSSDWKVAVAIYIGVYSVLVFVLLRLGLVTTIAAVFYIDTMNQITLGTDWKTWYAPAGLATFLLLLGIAVFAFWRSLGTRELFGPIPNP